MKNSKLTSVKVLKDLYDKFRVSTVNSEMTLQLNLKLTQFIIRLSNGEKLSNEELKELIELQKKFSEHVSSRTIDDGKDKEMFPK